MRYKGTDCALMCTPLAEAVEIPGRGELPGVMRHGDFQSVFIDRFAEIHTTINTFVFTQTSDAFRPVLLPILITVYR